MSEKTSTEGMSLIVRTVTRWLKGLLLLYGIYIVLYGHLSPGGGFAGGVIIACAFMLVTLGTGQKTCLRIFSKQRAEMMDSAGALLFLGIAFLGLLVAQTFFKNFITTSEEARFSLFSAGTMLTCNIGIGLKVGASLFLVFTILAALHVVLRKAQEDEP